VKQSLGLRNSQKCWKYLVRLTSSLRDMLEVLFFFEETSALRMFKDKKA